ncbi:bile acid:sodium symporter [Streptomyces sp. P9-1]|uniref:bile acid:sodium symporter n=1 Tax=Streptomyces sp. P9-1 TaxID=3422589 RepID=UPI003D361670
MTYLTTAAIALLFFMHGAKLSREKIIAGSGHWRLHLVDNVQYVCYVSDSGCYCLSGGIRLMSTQKFYYRFSLLAAFCRLPCSLQSPSRQWLAVMWLRRFAAASASSLLGDFRFTIAG